MNGKKWRIAIAVIVTAVLVIAILAVSRQWISKQVFMRSGHRLSMKFSEEQRKKYGEDLTYTLTTFWKFYEKGLISRNDLNDVMEKMKTLRGREEIKDMEIFDFIGYVSRIYTDAMQRRMQETFPQ